VRPPATIVVAIALGVCGCGATEPSEPAQAGPAPSQALASSPAGETRGFALIDFSFDQPDFEAGACPQGLNRNERDRYVDQLAQRDPTAAAQVPPGFDFIIADRKRGGVDPCSEPARFEDSEHLTFDAPAVSPGFDLDGVASTTASGAAAGSCAHQDFAGPGGERGIDNQLWRVLGCIEGYQRGSTIDEFAITNIKDGARTMLVQVSGIDDELDDPEVEVGLFSGVDPVPLDVNGDWLTGASLGATDDVRYHNRIPGRIVDGVVEAGPQDIALDFDGQFLDSEYVLRDARVRLEFAADGGMTGWVGGFWDIEGFYDTYARQATRLGVFTVGFRCPAMYHALRSEADAYPDPETGSCTAISTVFRMAGIPAFVILPDATGSGDRVATAP
jgi:hypothetical protein